MSSEINQPTSPSPAPFFDSAQKTSWLTDMGELWEYRFLLRSLILRDLKSRYKNSLLGVLWSLLNPLFMMLIYTVLFTILIPNDDIHHYPVFILVALIPWNFFSGALLAATVSITNHSSLVKKIYFPRILLPISAICSNFVNYLLSLIILVIFLFIYDIGLTIHALWVIPILITQIIFMLGLSFVFSALHTFYRDVFMVLEVGMLAWFFLTPVFYPFEWVTEQANLLDVSFNAARVMRWLNPVASMVDGYRTVLWGGIGNQVPGSMDALALLRMLITAVIVFIIGYAIFRRTEHLFGEKL
jgi:lipopolysaccharide transport system permease protein